MSAGEVLSIPLRTGTGQNERGHWRKTARRVAAERDAVQWGLIGWRGQKPATPCVVQLTRIAPSNGLDDDNLSGSLKAIRDEIAKWLGVDDRRRDIVRYTYAQRRGPWAVEIQIFPMTEDQPA